MCAEITCLMCGSGRVDVCRLSIHYYVLRSNREYLQFLSTTCWTVDTGLRTSQSQTHVVKLLAPRATRVLKLIPGHRLVLRARIAFHFSFGCRHGERQYSDSLYIGKIRPYTPPSTPTQYTRERLMSDVTIDNRSLGTATGIWDDRGGGVVIHFQQTDFFYMITTQAHSARYYALKITHKT
eukprot:scaffold50073_cov80-Phaeocystis_antarctica.AAC.4